MPFLDHLEELRWRLLKSIAAVVIGTLIGFLLVTQFNVLELLIDPLRPIIGEQKLKYLSPGDPFFVTLGLAVTVGLLLAFPIVASQIWGFISPALLPREKKAIVPALYLGLVLFAGGVALAYYIVLPMTLKFFMGFQTASLEQNIVIGPYIGLVVKVLLAFGILFELPVVILVLAALGLVTSKFLAEKRRYAIAAIGVVAAIATPGDAVTLTIFMMGPLILLYELSIFLARFVERRRRRALAVATSVAAALLLFGPANGQAQQPQTPPPVRPAPVRPAPVQQDTAKPKTPAQIVMEKVRRLGQAEVRDTAPDSLELRERTQSGTTQAARPAEPAADFPTDSIMRELMQLSGFAATQYRGQSVEFIADSSRLKLFGTEREKAGVAREGQAMVADSLVTFDDSTSVACGYGNPVLSGEGADAPVVSERVCYNTRSRIGMALGARTQVSEGANWFITGDLYSREKDLYTHHAQFTDCSLDVPHYHFAAREVKVINDNVMVARNVTLNFGDVPVFWLPFMMQSLKQGRRSGILMPEFSVNDIVRRDSDYDRRIRDVGFYWAISEKLGTKISLDWWSNNYTAVEGSFDYNILSQFMNGGATVKRYWREGGARELTVAANHAWEPNERTNLRLDGQYATSTAFIKETSYDPRELRRSIISNVGLSRRFDWASVSMQASRVHQITDDKIDWTLPSLGVNFATVTLFPNANTGTWTASAQMRRTQTDFAQTDFDPSALTGAVSSNLTLGKFSWSQSFDSNQQRAQRYIARSDSLEVIDPVTGDTTLQARRDTLLTSGQRMAWRTGINFQQRLIGTSTFTPGITVGQDLIKSDTLGNELISGPLRMDVNAALKLDLFGFWPGVGPLERFRHRISPSLTYAYSPKTAVDRADSIRFTLFGGGTAFERNTISIGINQTIEGKYKEETQREEEGADSAAVDSVSLDPDKPRRIPQARKVTVLSLNTDAVVYDFAIAKRGGTGVQTMQISNSINSDLLRGLQLTFSHELFGPQVDTVGEAPTLFFKRKFDPHLNRVSASFSLSNNSWLFRLFGLGKKTDAAPQTGSKADSVGNAQGGVEPTGTRSPEFGLIGSRNRQTALPTQRGPTGSWNASFNLTIERPREDPLFTAPSNQMVTTNVSFQPTQQWNLTWNTGYSFSSGDFTDHILTLTRQMHDWDANFNFVKAQNGNFSFIFNVALRANPDLKFDYSQRSLRNR